jgi:hypothetical protein
VGTDSPAPVRSHQRAGMRNDCITANLQHFLFLQVHRIFGSSSMFNLMCVITVNGKQFSNIIYVQDYRVVLHQPSPLCRISYVLLSYEEL